MKNKDKQYTIKINVESIDLCTKAYIKNLIIATLQNTHIDDQVIIKSIKVEQKIK